MGALPSIRLDHATLFSPAMIDRLNAARMSFAVVSHTIFLFAEYDSYERNLSPQQFDIAYPIRSFYEKVPYTALSSDTPATAWADADNVFVSIKAAVVRQAYNGADIGQAEAVTVPQALLLYTGRARPGCAARPGRDDRQRLRGKLCRPGPGHLHHRSRRDRPGAGRRDLDPRRAGLSTSTRIDGNEHRG